MFDGLSDINEIITFFALAGAIVQVIFVFNFVYSIFKGTKASKSMEINYVWNGQHQ